MNEAECDKQIRNHYSDLLLEYTAFLKNEYSQMEAGKRDVMLDAYIDITVFLEGLIKERELYN